MAIPLNLCGVWVIQFAVKNMSYSCNGRAVICIDRSAQILVYIFAIYVSIYVKMRDHTWQFAVWYVRNPICSYKISLFDAIIVDMYTNEYELKKYSVCMAGITDQLKKLKLSPSDRGAGRNISAETGLGYELQNSVFRPWRREACSEWQWKSLDFFLTLGFVFWLWWLTLLVMMKLCSCELPWSSILLMVKLLVEGLQGAICSWKDSDVGGVEVVVVVTTFCG